MASENELLGSGKPVNTPKGDPRVLPQGIRMVHKDCPEGKMVYRADVKALMEVEGWYDPTS